MNSTLPLAAPLAGAGSPLPGQVQLARLRRRAHAGIWIEGLGVIALLLVAFAVPSLLTDRFLRLEWFVRALLLASFVAVVARMVQRRLSRPLALVLTDDEMALAVERRVPHLEQALISSLQFERELRAGDAGVESAALKAAVVADVRARVATIPFQHAIDGARVRRFAAAIAAAVLFFGAWAALHPASLGTWALRNLALSNVDWPRFTRLSLAGGSSSLRVPQGDALTVRIAVDGSMPDQAWVDYEFADGERGAETMSRTGDAEFTWTIGAVLSDMTLSVQAGDSLPLPVEVTIVERPRIDDLTVRVTFPPYMERDPEVVPPTEGELRLPKGALLAIGGRSQKPLDDAFLLFGNDRRVALQRAADSLSFAGEFAPSASGLLVIDVVDRDRLGAGAPPKLVLRVGDDKPPAIEFRLRGIGPSITAHARLPGDLKVKDDFGLREVAVSARALVDQPVDKSQPVPAEAPFERAQAVFGEALTRSALRYETTAAVDLLQWNQERDENAPANRIRPGMLFSLRFHAKDNFGPGEPHEGIGETMTFRVVTRERLADELRRRQVEQRQEAERLLDEQRRATLELAEKPNPAAAGDKQKLAEAQLKALARLQQGLGRRTAFIGESYQRILWEFENNRLLEGNEVRQFEAAVPEPLAALAKEAFPAAARLVDRFAATHDEATRTAALDGYKDIEQRLLAIIKAMAQLESLAVLIEDLKNIIRLEGGAIDDVQQRLRQRERDIFSPRDPAKPKEKK